MQDILITIDQKNVPLSVVIDEIERKTGYSILIRNNDVNINEVVSISMKKAKLSAVLDYLFTPRKLKYSINNKRVTVYKPLESETKSKDKNGDINVVGKVVNDKNEILKGVTVAVLGTDKVTTTNAEGNFSIKVPLNSKIGISSIGFIREVITIKSEAFLNVVLKEEVNMLDEVVAVGYGSIKRKEMTSAISHISSKDFLNVSSFDPIMQIQGKVSGVSITNVATGDPNNMASIQVRGVSSRAAGLGPLIVIDGVPGGNLANVNSNDIESIDVLKDGAASAIYGTRGSNGVILVTTKKGTVDGKVHTSYTGYAAMDIINNELKTLSAEEFREYRVPMGAKDWGSETDWLDEVGRNAITSSHTLSLSGGNGLNNYRASMDYRNAQGIDLRSDRKEYGARLSFNHTSQNGLFKFTGNVAPRAIYNNYSAWSVFSVGLLANPTAPIKNPLNPSLYTDFYGDAAGWNPVEFVNTEVNDGEGKYLNWDATAKLNLLPLLSAGKSQVHSLSTQLTVAQQQNDNLTGWFRPSNNTRAINGGVLGEASRSYSKDRQESMELLLNYSLNQPSHHLKFMGGYSYQYFQNSSLSAENKDFDHDALTYNNLGNGKYNMEVGRNGMKTSKSDSRLIAFFGRVSYDYKERYLMTASLRYEGSSKFGNNNKWGYFPAISAGWRVTEESFMKNVSWINELKLRGDIGVTGNQNFASYLSLPTMRSYGSYYYEGAYFNVWGWSKNPNTNLKWEKGLNWNIGLDFSLLGNVVDGSINYYSRKQQDLLGNYDVPVPPFMFDQTFVNVGTMKNTGIEIDLNVKAINTKNFTYNINLVASTNNNKFLSFSNSTYQGQDYEDITLMDNPGYPGYLQEIRLGKRLGNFKTYGYAGVDGDGNWMVWNEDNTEAIPVSQATEKDKRITGNGLPKVTMSFNQSIKYKNWDMSVFFRGAFGFEIFNVHDFYYGLQSGTGNVLTKAYDKNAHIVSGTNVLTDYFIEKGDYLKLDVISLGYNFNINHKYIQNARIYATGRNIATFTKFSGVDPASYQVNGLMPGTFGGSKSYFPSSSQVLLGVQLSF